MYSPFFFKQSFYLPTETNASKNASNLKYIATRPGADRGDLEPETPEAERDPGKFRDQHGLRHTHITHLLKEGHSAKAVAERVGDNPITIDRTYAHVLASMREAIVKSVEQIYEEMP